MILFPRSAATIAVGLFGLGIAGVASAQSASPAMGRFALGVGGGANGGSVEAAYSINSYLAVRAQGAFIDFDHDFKSSDVTYRGKLRQNTAGGLVDLHPFKNPFFLSAGAVTGERKVRVDATPAAVATYRLNGVTYAASQIIGVNGDVDLGSTAPIVGLGYDNTFTHTGHWGFRAFAGAIIGDTPKVTLTATGPLATNSAVQANLRAEQASLQDDAKDYKYYPAVSIGLFYRF